jgi:antitoxin YefM
MKVLTISDVRKNFASVIDSVIDDAEECVIPRAGGKAVVIVSLDEWNSVNETLHLFGTRENTRRLLKSLEQADVDTFIRHEQPEADENIGKDVA